MGMAQLQRHYREQVVTILQNSFNYKNVMQIPRLHKIVLNMGVGKAVVDKKILENAQKDMELISGQKPIITKAKRSLSEFKIREGNPIGCKVTLRRGRMYEFLDRLINIALPRTSDFRGLSQNSFDGRGNYSLGIREQLIFPEIDYDRIDQIRGMDICIITTALTDHEAMALLSEFKFPFKK